MPVPGGALPPRAPVQQQQAHGHAQGFTHGQMGLQQAAGRALNVQRTAGIFKQGPSAQSPGLYQTPPQQRSPHGSLYNTPTQGGGAYVGGQFQVMNAQGQMVAPGASDPGQAGVGLFFQERTEQPGVYVKSIVKDGSAEREGSVAPGDVLQMVEGKPCPTSINELRTLILGEVGTFVSLTFERPDGGDGAVSTYEVSLMRSNAEYFRQMQHKAQMQEEVEQLRQALVHNESELDVLRGSLKQAESQADTDHAALVRLQSMFESAEQQMRTLHAKLQHDRSVRQELEQQVDKAKQQEMLDAQDVTKMQTLLTQAQDKLKTAEESLEATRQQKGEQEERLRQQRASREAAENHESELVRVIEAKMVEDDAQRALQEKTLLKLEARRQELEAELEQQRERVRAGQLEQLQVQQREQRAKEQLQVLEQDNARIRAMLAEADESRTKIEGALTEATANNARLEADIAALEDQGRSRQSQIEALKAQLEAQQSRWETALADDATERAKEEEAFKGKEEELLQQLNAVQHDTQELRALADKTKNQLGASLIELDAEIRQSAQALEAEEELAKSLQHRLSLLEAQQAKTDDELQAARAAKMDAEARVATAKTAKLRALERERALDVELARERQATADKLARLQETKRELEQAKADKAKQAAELEEVRRQAAREFEEAQRDLAHFQAVGKRLVEDERNRLSRDRLFQKSHSEAVEGMRQCMESQELLRTRLDAVVLPISDLQSYLDNSSLFPQDAVLAVVESPLPRPPLQSLHSNLTQQQAEAGASLKAGQEPPRPDWDSRKIGSTAEEEGQFSTVV